MSNTEHGELVPLVMVPRYTTYIGASTFATAPMDVSGFDKAVLSFWRGRLAGDAGSTFSAVFEASHDAVAWTSLGSAITTTNTSSIVSRDLIKRWLRLKITLTAVPPGSGGSNTVAITCWAVGSLEVRVA